MSSMSRNNSVNSLMGFSVHQPVIGAPLQFFPAMGSHQLDEMIDAYVPGDASILHKRAAVSMEFFEYSMATGDLFKFFMVYPALASTSTSPTTNSGSFSGFTTSPVMSGSYRTSHSPRTVSPSSSKKATSANDFCNLPGMKIMTKDGRDVTNSASRGCKTKEQRDHAHLMRIIKACDSCRRKKTKCDPSHQRSPASTSSGKVTKKATKNTRPAAAPPQRAATQAFFSPDFDQFLAESATSLDFLAVDSLGASTDPSSMDWDQFIQYDEEPTEAVSNDYDFFLDPAGYFSPTTTVSLSSSSTSPSTLPITPIDRDVNITDNTTVGHDHKPILPYLNPGGLEAGNNYVDFDLYSPQSSFLDEELDFAREVAASPIQSQRLYHQNRRRTDASPEAASSAVISEPGYDAASTEPIGSYRQDASWDIHAGLSDTSNYMHHSPETTAKADGISYGGPVDPQYTSRSYHGQAAPDYAAASSITIADSVIESATSGSPVIQGTIREPSRSRLNSGCRRQQWLVQHPAGDAATGRRERQLLPQGCAVCEASGVNHVTHPQSPSPRLCVIRSCGQDGLDIAKRNETSSTTKYGLSQPLGSMNVHRIRFSTTASGTIHEVSGVRKPSPLPAAARTQSTRSLSDEPSSQPISETMPWMSMTAGALSLAISLASPCTTIARSIDLVENAQPVGSGNVAIWTIAVLLLSLALCLASPIISLLRLSAPLITGGSIHLQRPISYPLARPQPSDSCVTHKLLSAKYLPIDPIGNVKFLFARFLHMAQCNLTRRQMPRIDSRTPAITRSSRLDYSRWFLRKTVMSRTGVTGALV